MTLYASPQRPLASVLIIGDEILSGRTQDRNLHYLAQGLMCRGIVLQEARVIHDDMGAITQAVRDAYERFHIVITTGGLGTTHDDITTSAVAQALGRSVVYRPDAWLLMEQHYGTPLDPIYKKMAYLPEDAILIPNSMTAAPGFSVDHVHVLAGVPAIMRAMFDALLPMLPQGSPWHVQSLTCTIEEGTIAQDLAAIQDLFPDVQIGSYPRYGEGVARELSLVFKGDDAHRVAQTVHACSALIQRHEDIAELT